MPPATLPAETAEPQITPELPNPPQQTTQVSSLRLWMPPEIGVRTEGGSQELMGQIRAYRTIQPNLDIVVEQKLIEGQGGILNYLQTGRTVAPSVMPDIVALPTSLLSEERIQDLVYPLEGIIDPAFLNDIYPAPAFQVSDDGHIFGYPFASSGLTHLILNPDVITNTISLNWSEFISDTNHTLVFPADGREGAILGLQFYLAEGGNVINDAGQPVLEAEPLTRALSAIARRKDNLLQSHQMKTLDESWQYFQLGLSETMLTRADYLLSRREFDPSTLDNQEFSAVPGPTGPLVPLTTSWAWTITTPDPVRQALAAELIQYLTTPENMASWSDGSHILPARRGAMDLLTADSVYYDFLDGQAERAQMMPVSDTSKVLDVLGDAVFQVLTTDGSPSMIAEQAVVALRQ